MNKFCLFSTRTNCGRALNRIRATRGCTLQSQFNSTCVANGYEQLSFVRLFGILAASVGTSDTQWIEALITSQIMHISNHNIRLLIPNVNSRQKFPPLAPVAVTATALRLYYSIPSSTVYRLRSGYFSILLQRARGAAQNKNTITRNLIQVLFCFSPNMSINY